MPASALELQLRTNVDSIQAKSWTIAKTKCAKGSTGIHIEYKNVTLLGRQLAVGMQCQLHLAVTDCCLSEWGSGV